MKWHKKLALIIIAIFFSLSLTMCTNNNNSVSTINTELSTQNSSKSKTLTNNTAAPNTTLSNTTVPKTQKTILESENPVGSEYFDDTVFVGDSVSEGLRKYASWQKNELNVDYFGKAQFLTAQNFGINNALIGNCLPVYKGQKIPIEDNIAQMDVKKLYILLGLNDVASFSCDKVIENYEELINRILSKKPGLEIFIESVTPITRFEESNKNYPNLDRAHVSALNDALKKMADDKNYYFLDVSSVLKDSEGFLPDSYSFDGTCHMRPEALDLWVNYLQTHTLK